MQVLEHEQHRRAGRVAGEQGQRLLEDPELGTCGGGGGPRAAERAKGLGERLVGQLGPDEVDGPAEQGLPPGLAGAVGGLVLLVGDGLEPEGRAVWPAASRPGDYGVTAHRREDGNIDVQIEQRF